MKTAVIFVLIMTVLIWLGSLMAKAETRKTARRRTAFGGSDDVAFAVVDVLIHSGISTKARAKTLLPEVTQAAVRVLGHEVAEASVSAALALAMRDPDMMDVDSQAAPIPQSMRPALAREATAIYTKRLNILDDEGAIYLRRAMRALGFEPAEVRAIFAQASGN